MGISQIDSSRWQSISRIPEKLFDEPIVHYLVTPDSHYLVGTLKATLICYDLEKRKMAPIRDAEAVSPDYS